MKKKVRKLLTIGIVALLMLSCIGTTAFAKTRKVKPDTRSYTSNAKKVEKKAKKVKKGTQTIIMPKSGRAYLKFVARKTGDYVFDVSEVKKRENRAVAKGTLSFVKTQKESYRYLRYVSAGTYGGRNVSLNFGSQEMKLGYSKTAWFLPHRTGTMHLKNGEVVYLYADTSAKSFKLKIKEK